MIGAGQAGLSAAYHLVRMGFTPYDEVVVLDRNAAPGGAWQHRWDSLTMHDVHGIANLPGVPVPSSVGAERANEFVPAYFADYEQRFSLPVVRPVAVESVRSIDGGFALETSAGRYDAAALVNATGTWNRPFALRRCGTQSMMRARRHRPSLPRASSLGGGLPNASPGIAKRWCPQRELRSRRAVPGPSRLVSAGGTAGGKP